MTAVPIPAAAPLTEKAVVTPEGVPLTFHLARVMDRFAAFLIDLLFLCLAIAAIVLLSLFLLWNGLVAGDLIPLVGALVVVAIFAIQTGYFVWFEIRWNGATPGKRRMGLRVMDRSGGMLRPEAIIARSLMRQLEVFIPLAALAAPEALWPGAPGWAVALALVWLAVPGLLPAFNKDRLRAGDLVAGTLVVVAPAASLLDDLSAERPSGKTKQRAEPEARFAFTTEQLDLYGIYELQVLEELLRNKRADLRALEVVRDKIVVKIGWKGSGKVPARRFLEDFYDAQRGRLERQMLLGERRERKKEGRGRGR